MISELSELWKSSGSLGSFPVREVHSAKGPLGRVPVGNCLDVDHMEEEVQVRVQVEVEREEQRMGETHGVVTELRVMQIRGHRVAGLLLVEDFSGL